MIKKLSSAVNSPTFFLILIVVLGAIFRFYKLDWGEGMFSHPDEYHIVGAAGRISFPDNLNPKLFSYGSFTVYLIYLLKILIFHKLDFFIIGRIVSAFFSTLTILLVYKVSAKMVVSRWLPLLAAFFTATSAGLIQQAHFATPDTALAFFMLLTVYFWTCYFRKPKAKYLVFAAISLGLAVSVKIYAVVFLPILILGILYKYKYSVETTFNKIIITAGFLITAFTSFFIFFPYSILDRQSFMSTNNYEVSLARGLIPVFYTRQFIGTEPLVFQFQNILPYQLGIFVLLTGTMGILIATVRLLKRIITKKTDKKFYILATVTAGFYLSFIPNAFLFVKWARYIVPALPFFIIFSVYLLSLGMTRHNLTKSIILIAVVLGIGINTLWALMFFSIYTHRDIRLQADVWLQKNLPENSIVLTEAGNMVEVPFGGPFTRINFDFYNLEADINLQNKLVGYLEKADYFIIQSRRMFLDQAKIPGDFPISARFYENLFNGNLGFYKVKEFNSYPKVQLGNIVLQVPDETAEETWSVFDHPVLRIYRKNKYLSQSDYEQILGIQ